MRRDQLTFFSIVAFAFLILGGGILVRSMSKDPPDNTPSSNTPAPSAPPGIVIEISSSSTKQDWLNTVIEQFNQESHSIASGEIITVIVTHGTSGGTQRDILAGSLQPTVWSPGDISWVNGANEIWRDRTGQPLVRESCPQTVFAPNGFAMWRPMAEALGWPDTPISWDTLVELSASSEGWASLGHPEWGSFKFGHTHPAYSNSGLLMMTALAYSTTGTTSGLTADEIYGSEVEEAFRRIELNTFHYGLQSRDLLTLMINRGPEYLHAVTTSEAEVLKINVEQADSLRFPLVFIFPAGGTYWSEHPYCIVDAEWVSEQEKEAAAIFQDYLLDPAQQALAIDNYLRPVDLTIALHAPLALESGTDPRITPQIVPALESPSSEVASAVKDVFYKTKKPATIILVLDTSGSMNGEPINNAVESLTNFISRLDRRDEVYVLGFGGENPYAIGQGGLVSQVGETLRQTVSGIYAEGATPLYDAVCEATELVDTLQADDLENQDPRLYGIVLLSDGNDTSSNHTENQMFSCLPEGESADGIKVFTIAYGADANSDLMLRIANRTNGKTFVGNPEDIERIYNAIPIRNPRSSFPQPSNGL